MGPQILGIWGFLRKTTGIELGEAHAPACQRRDGAMFSENGHDGPKKDIMPGFGVKNNGRWAAAMLNPTIRCVRSNQSGEQFASDLHRRGREPLISETSSAYQARSAEMKHVRSRYSARESA